MYYKINLDESEVGAADPTPRREAPRGQCRMFHASGAAASLLPLRHHLGPPHSCSLHAIPSPPLENCKYVHNCPPSSLQPSLNLTPACTPPTPHEPPTSQPHSLHILPTPFTAYERSQGNPHGPPNTSQPSAPPCTSLLSSQRHTTPTVHSPFTPPFLHPLLSTHVHRSTYTSLHVYLPPQSSHALALPLLCPYTFLHPST